MATITGKRFQMTDGAASPVNLFPYTVSEAVYGLNNAISNAISSALSTISLSTYAGSSAIGSSVQPVYYNGSALVACNLSTTYAPYNAAGYLPLTGGEINNASVSSNDTPLRIYSGSTTGSFIQFRSKNSEASGYIGASVGNGLTYADNVGQSFSIWHSGNDGSGSGLDADLLDGRHESQFLKYDWAGTQDCTSIMSSGFTAAHGWTNGPRGFGYGGVLTLRYDEYRAFQMFVTSQDNSTSFSNLDLYVRWSYYNGGQEYSAWKTLYHAGNSNLSTVDWTCNELTTYSSINARGEAALYHWYNDDLKMYIGYDVRGGYVNLYTPGINIILNTSANVGIGATSPTQKLHVVGNIFSTGDQIINSDLTMKMNLKDVTYSVSDIAKCRAVTFDWKDGHGHSAGSIAQDWKPLIPELVHGEEGGMTLAYGQIALVNSILEAREIERLKERVAELENQLKMRS